MAEETTQLEEVLVTAQKRTERLSDIPVSASVVSSEALGNLNAGDISDLNRLVPSVNINGSLNGRVPMGIRGVSSVSNEGTVGLSSGVAILIDGVAVPSDSVSANQLEDIQSVEVLRGPQGTLGGRAAATGVVNIVTRKPTDKFAGDVNLTLTDDHEVRTNAFLSGPLTSALDFSLSAYRNERSYPIHNIVRDEDTEQTSSGARVKLAFKPSDDLTVTLMGRYGHTETTGFNFVYTYLSPGTALPAGTGFPINTQGMLLSGITVDPDNLQYGSPVNSFARVTDKDVSLIVDWQLGQLTFGSVTAYQQESQNNVQDLFAVNSYWFNNFSNFLVGVGAVPAPGFPPFDNTQHLVEDVQQFSQEFKLASPASDDFSYLLGAYYSDSSVRLTQTRNLLAAYNNYDVNPVTKTYALYGRTTWKFSPSWSAVTGLRYNYDKLSYTLHQSLYTARFPPPVVVGPQPAVSDSNSSSTVVGDVSLQYRFVNDAMGYVTYARGYSPGAYNTVQAIESDGLGTVTSLKSKLDYVDKETVDHVEIGLKTDLLDRSARLNVSVFDTIYKNFQIQNFDKSSTAFNPPLILVPAGKAETRGIEMDGSWQAARNTRFDLNLAFIDARFKEYKGAPCYYPATTGGTVASCSVDASGTATQDLSGKTMPNAPKFKLTAGLEQKWQLSDKYDLVAGGNYAYRTKAQMLTDQNPHTIQPALGILNLTLGLDSQVANLSVTAFVNNVFDKHYVVDMEDFWSSPWGGTNTVTSQPARDAKRYFGIKVHAGF